MWEISFVGFMPEASHYLNCDIFTLPSLKGLPYVLLEAEKLYMRCSRKQNPGRRYQKDGAIISTQ